MYVTVYAFNVCINSCLKNCQELLALRLAWAPWCIYCHELLDICTNLLAPLAAALSLSHGLAGAVPVEEVEDCHELQCMYCHELRELLTSWQLHCRFRRALREPFQWRSWKTVMSSSVCTGMSSVTYFPLGGCTVALAWPWGSRSSGGAGRLSWAPGTPAWSSRGSARA